MKGAIAFLVGIIGLCVTASTPMLIPQFMGPREGMPIVLILVAAAFVFLNIVVVGFYRMLAHLHEALLYPEDAHYHPQRGRVLFFVGHIGLLVTMVFAIMIVLLLEMHFRMNHRQFETLLVIAWFVGWGFFGCLLGGVFLLLSDIFHKAFIRTMVGPPDNDRDDDLDISRGGASRSSRRDDRGDERLRRWDDE